MKGRRLFAQTDNTTRPARGVAMKGPGLTAIFCEEEEEKLWVALGLKEKRPIPFLRSSSAET